MECDNCKKAIWVTDARLKNLTASLEAMRTGEDCDVTLVCGDKQFGAHKLVLKASSRYFTAMFRSGMEEAKSGRVDFKSMEPDTMAAILKYIYVGDVAYLDTQERVTEVLAAAHMMELNELSSYCFVRLSSMMSNENCVEIWHVASIYEYKPFTDSVLGFVLANFKELKETGVFMQLNNLKLIQILNFTVNQQVCLDDMLCFVLAWLRHNVRKRKKLVNRLFSCIEPKFLSHECLKELLRDKNIMNLSPGITSKMNELCVAVFVLADEGRTHGTIQLVTSNVKEITTDERSSPKMIQNLPWNILVKSERASSTYRKIGFYVECNRESTDKSWSCKANVEYRLLSIKNLGQPTILRKRTHLFCSKANSLGYDDLMDLDKGLLKSFPWSGGITIFEAKISADPPHGVID